MIIVSLVLDIEDYCYFAIRGIQDSDCTSKQTVPGLIDSLFCMYMLTSCALLHSCTASYDEVDPVGWPTLNLLEMRPASSEAEIEQSFI